MLNYEIGNEIIQTGQYLFAFFDHFCIGDEFPSFAILLDHFRIALKIAASMNAFNRSAALAPKAPVCRVPECKFICKLPVYFSNLMLKMFHNAIHL